MIKKMGCNNSRTEENNQNIIAKSVYTVERYRKLPGETFTYEFQENLTTETECCICFEEYHRGMVMKTLKCNHVIHYPCILRWYQKASTCPMCRCEITK